MGLEGWHPRQLSEQASVTGRPLSIIIRKSWRLGNFLLTGSTQTLYTTFTNARRMSRATEGCAPEQVYSHAILRCLKKMVAGFTHSRLYLAFLFASSEERRGFLDMGEQWF